MAAARVPVVEPAVLRTPRLGVTVRVRAMPLLVELPALVLPGDCFSVVVVTTMRTARSRPGREADGECQARNDHCDERGGESTGSAAVEHPTHLDQAFRPAPTLAVTATRRVPLETSGTM
jgi:hypothetical protein